MRGGPISASPIARLGPWILAAVAVALGLVGILIGADATDRGELAATLGVFGVTSVVYALVGAFLAARPASRTIGWLLLGAGIAMSILAVSGAYATEDGGAVPAARYAAWVASWAFVPALALSGALLLFLFPTGRPPSPSWRPVVVAVIAVTVLAAIGFAFRPGRLAVGDPIPNPFGFQPLGGMLAALATAGDVLFPLLVAAGAASMIVRYRRAPPEERYQIRWFAFVAVVLAVAFLVALLPLDRVRLVGWIAGTSALAALPIAIAIAVLRYRLYDIDLIINRTLAWVGLIGVLGGVYAAVIALLQRGFVAVTGNTSDAAVVITTLILAGIFTPVRKELEATVDRRFKPRTDVAPDAPVSQADLQRVLEPLIERVEAIERAASGDTREG